jgi:hypothetical protein
MATVRIKSWLFQSPTAFGAAVRGVDRAPVPPISMADKPAAQSAKEKKAPHLLLGLAAVGLIVFVAWFVARRTSDPNFSNPVAAPVAGLTIFAVFYVTAQAIERLLEPVSSILLPKDHVSDDYAKKLDAAEAKVVEWVATVGDSSKTQVERDAAKAAAEAALQATAAAKAKLDAVHGDRVIAFWAVATAIGMWASATLHLYFLKVVGVSGGSRALEILATGLIVGSGTKPLHDLITRISAKAEATTAADAETASTTTTSTS